MLADRPGLGAAWASRLAAWRAARPVKNTTGLPPAKRRRLMSAGASSTPHDLTEHKDQKVTQAAGSCWRCQALPSSVVPEALRGLSLEAAQALLPFKIDVGPVVRAKHSSGYSQHATMIRFLRSRTRHPMQPLWQSIRSSYGRASTETSWTNQC